MNNIMRRKDREVLEYSKMIEIMKKCDCCRLGFNDEKGAYIVPMNFAVKENKDEVVLYFHSAAEGKKIELIKEQKYAGFEMDTKHELVESKVACGYSFLYQSIIGSGEISLVDNAEEKINGLQCIMEHYSNKSDWNITEAMVKKLAIIKLIVKEWACKEH